MDDELKQALNATEERIGRRFDQTDERIHDVETKPLKAFYDRASSRLPAQQANARIR